MLSISEIYNKIIAETINPDVSLEKLLQAKLQNSNSANNKAYEDYIIDINTQLGVEEKIEYAIDNNLIVDIIYGDGANKDKSQTKRTCQVLVYGSLKKGGADAIRVYQLPNPSDTNDTMGRQKATGTKRKAVEMFKTFRVDKIVAISIKPIEPMDNVYKNSVTDTITSNKSGKIITRTASYNRTGDKTFGKIYKQVKF